MGYDRMGYDLPQPVDTHNIPDNMRDSRKQDILARTRCENIIDKNDNININNARTDARFENGQRGDIKGSCNAAFIGYDLI